MLFYGEMRDGFGLRNTYFKDNNKYSSPCDNQYIIG